MIVLFSIYIYISTHVTSTRALNEDEESLVAYVPGNYRIIILILAITIQRLMVLKS
jgi:hypothetical protein